MHLLRLALALGAVCSHEKQARAVWSEARSMNKAIDHVREQRAHETAREFYFAGEYRPRLEIFRRLISSRVWRGAHVTETETHFMATLGNAVLKIAKAGKAVGQ
jgi:hypothetical protein